MKAASFYFLKIFVYMTLAYGGSQLLVYLIFSDSFNVLAPVFSGLAFGFSMALVFTISQAVQVKKLHKGELTPEALSVHQVAGFQTPLTKEQILEKLQNNYPTKDWKLTEEANQIKLNTTFSAQSFGEKVSIKVTALQNGLSEVLVESHPKFKLTLTDYGKNLKNITYLKHLLAA